VQVQLHNPTDKTVTFDLLLSAEEDPNVGGETTSSISVQVTLGPGEIRNIPVNMPITSWGALVDYVDVVLTVSKRRVPGEAAHKLDFKSFVIE
jgi:hypothetical protein